MLAINGEDEMNKLIAWVCGVALLLAAFFSHADPATPNWGKDVFDLSGQAGLPKYLKCTPDALADAMGIRGGEVRTVDTDFINKDFILDVVFQFQEDERSIAVVGIGENARDGGWIVNSVLSRIHGPKHGGYATVTMHRQRQEGRVGDFKTAGPHLFRLEKKGNALTMAIFAKYDGKATKPDFTKTIPRLQEAAPYLNRVNSALFFGGDAWFRAVRLEVDGKLVEAGLKPAGARTELAGNEGFFRLKTGNPFPDFLAADAGLMTAAQGLPLAEGHSVRTRGVDFLSRDFTLDVVFRFAPDSRETMIVGIGENGREGNWILNSVCSRVHGPAHGGYATITWNHRFEEGLVGKFGRDHPGPNLFRLQKRGDTLTMAICVDYKGTYAPDFVKTIPSLSLAAPYLNARNTPLFIADGGLVEQVRLVLDGKVQENAAPGAAPASRNGKLDALYKLALAGDKHQFAPGLGNTMLVLEGDQLRRLEPDGFTVRQTLKLPHACGWIGERKDYFVGLSDETRSLDLIDKTTLKVSRSIQMDYPRRYDLALHPGKPACYVSVEKPSDHGLGKSILIVDEASGDVHEPEDFIGTWIRVSPDGKRLYAAYKGFYRKGDRLLVNPDRIHLIPEYGNIDWLIIYDITGRQPQPVDARQEVGGNGQGLTMSADGKRLSYLSFVGYPLHSGNIPAWDPTDLTKRPVSYPAKANKADCKRIAFHPILPIAAAPSEAGAACFDRETGQFQPNRLDLRTPLGDAVEVLDLFFSPDGNNLILDCQSAGQRFLRKVKLNLDPAESAQLKNRE